MHSRGSVIPLFVEQLLSGQPLTVTDPLMTRFMMTLADAVDLVDYALTNGAPGDLFVKKAPAASIKSIILALGNIFNVEVPMKVIGVRHGEKVYETLVTKEELSRSVDEGGFFRVSTRCSRIGLRGVFRKGRGGGSTTRGLQFQRDDATNGCRSRRSNPFSTRNSRRISDPRSCGGGVRGQRNANVKIAITGAEGFFGRHLCVRLRAQGLHEVVAINRRVFCDQTSLAKVVSAADVVVHLAGVNRGDPAIVEFQNEILARQLVWALDFIDSSAAIVFANSIHAGTDTPYGRGKERAFNTLHAWACRRGRQLINIRYQNLFGEGGRPRLNSFVATFCHRLASGGRPDILVDRPLELIHAQDAAQTLIDLLPDAGRIESMTIKTQGIPTSVTGVLARLEEIRETYAHGSVPDLGDDSHGSCSTPIASFSFQTIIRSSSEPRSDARGAFVEAVRSFGGQSQTSFSTTVSGVTRRESFPS